MQPRFFWERYIDPEEEVVDKRLAAGSKKLFVADSTRVSKMLEAWVLHSPFDYNHLGLDLFIKSLPSVEIFQPITRYRAFIAFGKSYYDALDIPDLDAPENSKVKHLQKLVEESIINYIEQAEIEHPEPEQIAPEFQKLINTNKIVLDKLGKVWVMLIFLNGSIASTTGESDDDPDLQDKLNLYNNTVNSVGGLVLKSWDSQHISTLMLPKNT